MVYLYAKAAIMLLLLLPYFQFAFGFQPLLTSRMPDAALADVHSEPTKKPEAAFVGAVSAPTTILDGDADPDAAITPVLGMEPTHLEADATLEVDVDVDSMRTLRRYGLAQKLRAVNILEDEARDRQDVYFLLLAVVPALLAFMSWDEISLSVAHFIDRYGAVGRAVDGNQFANDLLRPTITGVVVPVISIALATLVSTTINVLRSRQVELRALVNKEACDLRLLRRAVFGMFGTRQHAGRRVRALLLMTGYIDQINGECSNGAIESLEELQLSGGIAVNELDRMSAMLHGVDGAAVSRQGSVDAADDIIVRLNDHRSDRVALLLSVFPAIHWGVLIALSLSVCVTFLLESNQLVNQYLNSIQLRSLFTILVGVCSATATLCLDLADPFTGSFSIEGASTQLGDLRLCLQEDVREAKAEAGDISSVTSNFLQSLLGGPRNGSTENANNVMGKSLAAGLSEQRLPAISGTVTGGTDEDAVGRDMLDPALDRNGNGGNKLGTTPSRYGLLSTVYFHLLTGPLGSNVRALGDAVAWAITIVMRRSRALLTWKQWPWRRRNSTA